MIATVQSTERRERLSDQFISDVLSCYFPHTTYLKEAAVVHRIGGQSNEPEFAATGRFGIDRSCYIEDTGHFNAVEFNICFNQLAYVLYAHCFKSGALLSALSGWGERLDRLTSESFDENQLSAMLILSISSCYKKPIDSRDFTGRIEVGKIKSRGTTFFSKNKVVFTDREDGYSEGEVTLAFVQQNQ